MGFWTGGRHGAQSRRFPLGRNLFRLHPAYRPPNGPRGSDGQTAGGDPQWRGRFGRRRLLCDHEGNLYARCGRADGSAAPCCRRECPFRSPCADRSKLRGARRLTVVPGNEPTSARSERSMDGAADRRAGKVARIPDRPQLRRGWESVGDWTAKQRLAADFCRGASACESTGTSLRVPLAGSVGHSDRRPGMGLAGNRSGPDGMERPVMAPSDPGERPDLERRESGDAAQWSGWIAVGGNQRRPLAPDAPPACLRSGAAQRHDYRRPARRSELLDNTEHCIAVGFCAAALPSFFVSGAQSQRIALPISNGGVAAGLDRYPEYRVALPGSTAGRVHIHGQNSQSGPKCHFQSGKAAGQDPSTLVEEPLVLCPLHSGLPASVNPRGQSSRPQFALSEQATGTSGQGAHT